MRRTDAREPVHDRDDLLELVEELVARRPGLRQPRRGTRPSPMNSISSSVSRTCTGYGTADPLLGQSAQRIELGPRPAARRHGPPIGRAPGDGPDVSRVAQAPPLLVPLGAMEVAGLRPAVALGRQDAARRRVVGNGAFQQKDVGLLARLDDAELGVECAGARDQPVGPRKRTALGRRRAGPGGPPLTFAGFDAGEGRDAKRGVRKEVVRKQKGRSNDAGRPGDRAAIELESVASGP